MNTTIHTEDGKTVAKGDTVYNYYDREVVTITSDPGTDGWFTVVPVSGPVSYRYLNGERICTVNFATKKGWI